MQILNYKYRLMKERGGKYFPYVSRSFRTLFSVYPCLELLKIYSDADKITSPFNAHSHFFRSCYDLFGFLYD